MCFQHCPGEPEALHSHGGGAQYCCALQLVTTEIYETDKVARTQFHDIHSDLDTALRQSERSPEKAALSPVPIESTH